MPARDHSDGQPQRRASPPNQGSPALPKTPGKTSSLPYPHPSEDLGSSAWRDCSSPQLSLETIKKTLFRTDVAKTRELSIEAERNDDARIRIYSDGSSSEAGVGASALMYETGQPGHTDRKARLGEVTDHTTYEAELVGALMAVHLAAKVPPNSTVSIYVDNQSTLAAITSPPDGPGSHITEALNEAMKTIATRRPVLAKRIVFHWISSHSGVEGNEMADRLAKEAAAGAVSPANLLPDLLVGSLPRSPTAVRAEFRKALVKDWTHFLEKSPRRDRLRTIDPSFHPAKILQISIGPAQGTIQSRKPTSFESCRAKFLSAQDSKAGRSSLRTLPGNLGDCPTLSSGVPGTPRGKKTHP